jgi:hypothetical protein
VSGPRLAVLLLQVAAGVGLGAWLWREFSASAPQRLPPRTVAVIVACASMIVVALAATAAFGREELGTGLLLLIGAGAVLDRRASEPTLPTETRRAAYGRWRAPVVTVPSVSSTAGSALLAKPLAYSKKK